MSRHLIVAFVSVAAMTACSSGAGTSTDSTSEQQLALTEASASAEDARATADACFAAFETCKDAEGADLAACKTTLEECLPAEAHPGPHCGPPRGKGPGHPNGPHGDCDGGPMAEGRPGPLPDGGRPPPPPPPPDGEGPDGEGPDGDGPGGDRPMGGGPGGGHGPGREPGFCKRVPLPATPEILACRGALDACIGADTDDKTCFDAHHACVKAAFDAAMAAAPAPSTN